jgi:hypothetical protein
MDPSNVDFESSYADGVGHENLPSTEDANEEESSSKKIRKERDDAVKNTATQLEAILNDVKGTTERLLQEMNIFLKEAESVTIDYTRCQESQRNEAHRLEACQPDVQGATHRFLQEAQAQLAMAGHVTTDSDGADLESMLASAVNYE